MDTTKFLIKTLQVTLLVLFTTVSFGCWNIAQNDKSPGNYVKEERSVSNFSALEVGGAFKVVLSQGNSEKLMVEADEDDMQYIVTEVLGDMLKIYTKPGHRWNFHDMTVYLTFRKLSDISFSGAVEVESEGQLAFEGLRLDVSGAAEIEMDFTATKLDAEFSGASEVDFKGKCEKGVIEISGASDFNAEFLEFTNLVIDLSGASDAKVFATGELEIDASGASSVRYKGGASVSVNTSGASDVKKM